MFTDDDRRFLDRRRGWVCSPSLPNLTPGRRRSPCGSSAATPPSSSSRWRPRRRCERVERTPYASLVAVNHLGEPEHWVAVAGAARVERPVAFELAARLAARYWDLSDPERARTLRTWERVGGQPRPGRHRRRSTSGGTDRDAWPARSRSSPGAHGASGSRSPGRSPPTGAAGDDHRSPGGRLPDAAREVEEPSGSSPTPAGRRTPRPRWPSASIGSGRSTSS